MMMDNGASLPPDASLADLQDLNASSAYYSGEASYTSIRDQALQEAAQTLGTQGGLAYESQQINAALEQNASTLDRVFDFNQVMYEDNVLPPVLNTANNLVNINSGGSTIRIAGATYTILSPAHFVTSPPTWRDYIWMNYPPPELPDKSLLPQTSGEEAFWNENVSAGWQQGINQAISIFTINLNRLTQDFDGMILYKELLIQNMVSPYAVNRTEQGITGNGQHMVIDDQTIQLTTQPQLLPSNNALWQALPVSVAAPPPPPAAPPLPATQQSDASANAASLENVFEKAMESDANSAPATQ